MEYINTQMQGKNPSNILILGCHGAGKKFILEKAVQTLQKRPNFSVLKFAGDQIIELNKEYCLTKKEFEFSLSLYVGLAWTSSEKNDSKMDYLLNCLRKVDAAHIILFAPDLEEYRSEAKDIFNMLVYNKEFLEKQLSKTICILASACDRSPIGNAPIAVIDLPDYTLSDIKEYVETVLCYHPHDSTCEDTYQKLHEICGANLNLVNLLYRDLFENSLEFGNSLGILVSQKMEHLKQHGNSNAIKAKDIEEIVMTCSLSVECFSRFEISQVAERSEEMVNESVQLSINECVLKEVSTNLFDFTSTDVKGVLEEKMIARHNTRLLGYYNYLLQYRPDEYFLRAYYMIKYDKTISENAYSLLVLATEQAFMFNDGWIERRIREFIESYGDQAMKEQYDRISQAYRYHKNRKYQQSLQVLSEVDDLETGQLGRIELARLKFKNYYLLHQTTSFECKQALATLKEAVQTPLLLQAQEGVLLEEERIFKLRIIYDIAPFVLDAENEYNDFQQLYQEARHILAKEKARSSRKRTVQYINSIFNKL